MPTIDGSAPIIAVLFRMLAIRRAAGICKGRAAREIASRDCYVIARKKMPSRFARMTAFKPLINMVGGNGLEPLTLSV